MDGVRPEIKAALAAMNFEERLAEARAKRAEVIKKRQLGLESPSEAATQFARDRKAPSPSSDRSKNTAPPVPSFEARRAAAQSSKDSGAQLTSIPGRSQAKVEAATYARSRAKDPTLPTEVQKAAPKEIKPKTTPTSIGTAQAANVTPIGRREPGPGFTAKIEPVDPYAPAPPLKPVVGAANGAIPPLARLSGSDELLFRDNTEPKTPAADTKLPLRAYKDAVAAARIAAGPLVAEPRLQPTRKSGLKRPAVLAIGFGAGIAIGGALAFGGQRVILGPPTQPLEAASTAQSDIGIQAEVGASPATAGVPFGAARDGARPSSEGPGFAVLDTAPDAGPVAAPMVAIALPVTALSGGRDALPAIAPEGTLDVRLAEANQEPVARGDLIAIAVPELDPALVLPPAGIQSVTTRAVEMVLVAKFDGEAPETLPAAPSPAPLRPKVIDLVGAETLSAPDTFVAASLPQRPGSLAGLDRSEFALANDPEFGDTAFELAALDEVRPDIGAPSVLGEGAFVGLAPSLEVAPPSLVIQSDGAALQATLYAPSTLSEDDVAATAASISSTSIAVGSVQTVEFRVSQNQVRYFDIDSARAAERLADAIGAVARDFTGFDPSPPPGTLEIYLAGGPPPAPAARPTVRPARTAPAPNRPSSDSASAIRDRLISTLRSGAFQ